MHVCGLLTLNSVTSEAAMTIETIIAMQQLFIYSADILHSISKYLMHYLSVFPD